MIPIGDHIRLRHQPIIVYCLLSINIAVFLWQLKLQFTGDLSNFINNWGLIPAQFSGAINHAIFSNPAAWVVVVWGSISLVSSLFIHSGFSHIIGNLLFLWVFGKTVEDIMGKGHFLLLYLSAGTITGMAEVIAHPNVTAPLVGSNGAIAALLAAYIIKLPKQKIDTILPLLIVYIPITVPAYFYLLWWFCQQLFYTWDKFNISPLGVNALSIDYVQLLGLLIGGAFMHISQRGTKRNFQ